MNKDDIANINYWIHHNLKPYKRRSTRRVIKLEVSSRTFNALKKVGATGRFRSAELPLKALGTDFERKIEIGIYCTISNPQIRVSEPKMLNNLVSKPCVTIRFIVNYIYK